MGLVIRGQFLSKTLNQVPGGENVGTGCSVWSSSLGGCLTWESRICWELQEMPGESERIGKPTFTLENKEKNKDRLYYRVEHAS